MPTSIFQTPQDFRKHYDLYLSPDPIVTTSGGFDPLHVGHLRCIQETVKIAREKGGISVIIVNGDGFLTRKKGRPFMDHDERMEIVKGVEGVDYVVGWDDGSQTVTGCIEVLKPAIFTKGGDRSDPSRVPESEVCNKIGCKIIFGVGGTDKSQSSSDLIAAFERIDDSYDLTRVNEQGRHSKVIEKPWGSEKIITLTDQYAAKVLTILPDARLSRQYHVKKDETIHVVKGTLKLEIGDGPDMTTTFLSSGDSFRIAPGTIHRFCSWFDTVSLFEVSTPELDDVVRISDDFGRV